MPDIPVPITAAPDGDELARRLERVRTLMDSRTLDYYVSFDPINIYYLTNFANFVHERPFILVIGKTGTPKMLAPYLELSHVQARAQCDLEYLTYDEFPAPTGHNWYDLYPTMLDAGTRVGIEEAMPVGIARQTPGEVVLTNIIDDARMIKTEYEIGRTVHACSVVDLGHEKLLELCKPGIPEATIFATVGGLMNQKVFTDIPQANFIVTKTWGAVWPPSISHDPHRIPTLATPMEHGGPHVSIVWAQVDGYGVELERTFFLGEVPEPARRPFETMYAGRARAFEMLRPGQDLAAIDAEVREIFNNAGYGDCILHRTGHGFGITGHEAPFLAIGESRVLEAGMIVSVEPGIYKKGAGGFRHSDTVLITEDGYRNLTHAPDRLEDLVF